MDIVNKDTYYNSIYQAIIVDEKLGDDPEGKGRYQIYIPEVHYRYEEQKDKYIAEEDKSKSQYKTLFPWAVSLISGLKEGDQVYGSYINNLNNSFIILGKDARADELGSGGFDGSLGLDAILDLAMPIIIENEVGINRKKWPDGITDDQYGNVTSNDNGAWSIGLIQWHGVRAFDILYQIAVADSNWTSNWSDQSLDIVSDLQSAVKSGSSSPKRNKWDKVVSDSSIITGTRKMLVSAKGKETQKAFARSETKIALDKLTQDPYNIMNPAILIFCMDIMNQYGNGVNSVINRCLEKAASISRGNGSMIEQLKDYRDYWRSKTSYVVYENGKKVTKYRYDYRRTNTYDYIVQLDKEGKLDCLTFTDLTELQGFKYIPEYGEYFWPTTASDQINCMYGDYTSSKKAAKGESTAYATYNGFKYNWAGLDHGTFHWGIDIAPKKGGVDGDPLIACGSGEVVHVNGGGVDHRGSITTANPVKGPGQGNCIAIKMDKNKSHNFVYMHLCKAPTLKVGDRVKAGDVIGYMGSTGSSTGTHLHIGLHIDSGKDIWKTASTSTRPDPLPYFGKKVKGISTSSNKSSSSSSGGTADDIINYARTFLGNAYKWGGKTPPNFDCSGLTHYVYKHFGYEIGQGTDAQRKVGIDVKKSDLQKADLVHFHNSDHVGIYISNGDFIHSPKTGDVVKISNLSESYYVNHWLKGTRILGHVKKS